MLKTTFERTESIQVERFEGVTDTSKVEWINDCEWRIIPINPKTNADSRAYLFKILSTTDDTYTFEFKQSGRDQTYSIVIELKTNLMECFSQLSFNNK